MRSPSSPRVPRSLGSNTRHVRHTRTTPKPLVKALKPRLCRAPGVQKGTTQQDDLTARSKACTDAGKPAINLVIEQGQDKVTADLIAGKTSAMAADSPVALYAVKQTNGQLAALGVTYDSAPYGWIVPKTENDFAAALVTALKAADADGSYKAALTKWGVDAGAITDFAVNP